MSLFCDISIKLKIRINKNKRQCRQFFNENLDIPPAQQQQEFAQLARELPFVNNIPGHQEINPTVEQQAVHRPTRRTNRPDRYGCNIFET